MGPVSGQVAGHPAGAATAGALAGANGRQLAALGMAHVAVLLLRALAIVLLASPLVVGAALLPR
jgi:hypothetical protein